ncbi:PREDICTED: uncharacterized protein LOC109242603 [Nicotiana attenuata]|uniref:uncharacterized protein LOC109242603 n=1 Tax=Nicotiana attenuata TaxID=49451 RepID=UPI000904E11A|nr:PREDICTED: uncharacterized protein LOC109242603 [Nicotiana attenuata]
MEGVSMMKRRQRGQQQPQENFDNYDDGGGYSNECYDDQSEEVQYVNNYQGNRGGNWGNNNSGNQGNWYGNNNWNNKNSGQGGWNNNGGQVQLGQISQSLNTRQKGALPSDTVVNPKGGHNNHVMAVTTRSGRGGDVQASKGNRVVVDEEELQNDEMSLVVENVVEPNASNDVRVEIDEGEEETQEAVNPSREHVSDMPEPVVPNANAPLPRPPPPYPQRSMECETIKTTHQVSSVVHSMAPKLEDPGAFTIPCTIGSANFAKALCDLGASINLMPYSVFKTLGIGQPRPTSMRLQMVDRSMKWPLGIIDDVLVRVDKFILPADFVILDCEVDFEVSIILGRPFLATGKAFVDVEVGELTFRVGDEKVVFHVCKSMKQPNSTEMCSFVAIVTAVIVDETSAMANVEDPLEAVLLNMDVDDDAERVECVNALHGMGSYSYEPRKLYLDLKNRKTPPTKPSIEEPPVDATLAVLQKRKRAIGWTLADIRGISPAFCMHKIILEEDARPSLEHQRRLNEAISWTSPVQCVPKRGGMTVVTNDNNELIPTRTVTGWRVCMDYRKLNKKDAKYMFDERCMEAFELLKQKLTTTPIITAPNWSLPFELMCDASDVAVRAVLGQRISKMFHPVYY